MEEINIINTILIILIIIIIINHLLDNRIIKTILYYFNKLNYSNNLKEIDISSVFKKIIIQSDVKKTINMNNPINASKKMVNILTSKLTKTINIKLKKYNYRFSNVILNNNIQYYKGNGVKYFKPFNITARIYYKNKKLGKMSISIELFAIEKTNELVLLNIAKEQSNYSDVLTDNNTNKNNNTDIFIKPSQHIDDNNSLIPSVIDITSNDSNDSSDSTVYSHDTLDS
jgi:hypothetical protein